MGSRLWKYEKLFTLALVLILTASGGIFPAESPHSWEFSLDGKQVICTFQDKIAKIWDAATGREIRTISGYADSTHDWNRILSFSGTEMKIWDTATGRELRTFNGHTDSIWYALFSPNGEQVLSCTGTEMKLWDAATGRELRSFQGHVGRVDGALFSPDGGQILSLFEDEEMEVWETETGRKIALLQHTGVKCALFSPDGGQVLSRSGDGTIKLWNIATGREILTQSYGTRWNKFSAFYYSYQEFSPDKRQVFTMFNHVMGLREYKIWDTATGREIGAFTWTGWGDRLRFSPDGKQLLSVTGAEAYNELKLLDVTTGRELRAFRAVSEFEPNGIRYAEFSPDGKQILCGYGSIDEIFGIILWETATGREIRAFSGGGENITACFSPDGSQIASSSITVIEIRDAATGRVIRTFSGRHKYPILDIEFSPDGSKIYSSAFGYPNHESKLWDAATGREIITWNDAGDLRFSPGGREMLFLSSNRLQLYDANTGRLIRTLIE